MICDKYGVCEIFYCFVSQDFTTLCFTKFFSFVVDYQVQEKFSFSTSLLPMDLLKPLVSENAVYVTFPVEGVAWTLLGTVSFCNHLCTILLWTVLQDCKGTCIEFSTKLKPQSTERIWRTTPVAPMFLLRYLHRSTCCRCAHCQVHVQNGQHDQC